MNKNKILVVYIATGAYKLQYLQFRRWLNKLFCPDSDKYLVVMSDDISYFYQEKFQKSGRTPDNFIQIDHQPWPIPTLMKFHYIKEAMDHTGKFDYVFYFNANLRFNRVVPDEMVLKDTITTLEHWGWTTYMDRNFDNIWNCGNMDPENNAYIADRDWIYHQACMLGGPKSMMYWLCNIIINWTNEDLKRCRIPNFHDESYFNRAIHDYPENFNTLPSKFHYDAEKLYDLVDDNGEVKAPYVMLGFSEMTQQMK